MKKNILTTILFCISISVFSQQKDYTTLVNPFIGTGGHGHTYPGATMPFGMVQLSPDTRLTGWDGCSAYHYSDSVIYGFSHTHLNGTGCSDYGDVLLMPMNDNYSFNNENYSCSFSHKNEFASPGYYKVKLDNGIDVELTASNRVGFHRYIYPSNKNPYVILDLKHRDEVLESYIEVVNDTIIKGYRRSKAWAADQRLYFVIQFSKPIKEFGIALNDTLQKNLKKVEGKNVKAYFSFNKKDKNILFVKVGISAVSTDGAYKNLKAEIPGWNFEKIKELAKNEWNKELGKVEVEGGTKDQQIVFYSAMYHAFINPNLYMDVDGQYLGTDFKIHKAEGFDNYTVFSLWDTYRAAHPLYTIIDQKRTNDFINTFINEYKNGGLLPMWELSANETFCMIGYHSIPVIADAYIKGIKNYDTLEAFKAMRSSADADRLGLAYYKKFGHIPGDKESESVSKTLEYAYDDWCIAQMAKGLNKTDDYKNFIQRAQYYKNVFDPGTKFMRAKWNGGWYKPFTPTEVNNNYTEGNSWQYSFYVPQDISTMMELYGGKEKFLEKLDSLFYGNYKLSGREQVDITGLIGQYAQGNEPSHHMAYLYDYAGKPWKTQELIHKIEKEMYLNTTDGLCGNEDCGQMSAWYVMSAMGFYHVCPGNLQFAIGTPVFSKVKIHLENGKTFTITSKNISPENFYIQSATLNGVNYNKSYFTYSDLMKGGNLELTMDSKPNKIWATNENDCPKTKIDDYPIALVPYFVADGKTFYDSIKVEIKTINNDQQIFYTLNGANPDSAGILYTKPLVVKNTTKIKAISKNKLQEKSFIIEANFIKITKGRSVKIISKYDPQYTAGGDEGLIDNIRGESDFRLGGWQGYQAQDFEAVVDLGKEQKVNKIAAGFLQDVRSWIVFPVEVEYSVSSDGKNFKDVETVKNIFPDNDYTPTIKDFSINVNLNCRYVKIKAKNYGKLPSWHLGAGGDAYIFTDEIIVE
ncbi:MAG TPA: GH92 family glycosyl hydrolase [Bacteroidales bacterium]|nr:GH92 family glycosyl hydrolase [Bacteroidales bacterium]HPS15891.1 GH92 family glycosyl hydrolase [Bacteroidales bacterium]